MATSLLSRISIFGHLQSLPIQSIYLFIYTLVSHFTFQNENYCPGFIKWVLFFMHYVLLSKHHVYPAALIYPLLRHLLSSCLNDRCGSYMDDCR